MLTDVFTVGAVDLPMIVPVCSRVPHTLVARQSRLESLQGWGLLVAFWCPLV